MSVGYLYFRSPLRVMVSGLVAIALVVSGASAAAPDGDKIAKAVQRAADFLAKAQEEDGSFSSKAGTGVTAIVTAALLRSGRTTDDPVVAKALKFLEAHIHPDGGVYHDGSTHKNYETCLAIMAFNEANADKKYSERLANAEKFIKKQQWDDDEGKSADDWYFGGAGYGSSSRPDLSNTSFLIEALHSLGRDEEDPAMQRALVFVSRCQNLTSQDNSSPFADKVNDGGFYYTVAAGGSSPAGTTDDGGLRSYGSMTYAGFKSMIYAGVNKDDPRVKAAYEWIQKHYTLDDNPGMGPQGLYYYYHTFAKALSAFGVDELTDNEGKTHNWRAELTDKLVALQNEDGSWVNAAPRWMEADPNLVTAYGLLTLSHCKVAKKQ